LTKELISSCLAAHSAMGWALSESTKCRKLEFILRRK
jgi:hypothetical protein